ncbi:hydantoinase/oxoprolinase N-terminal domain-containing protein [Loktanella sp. S4079]|uniref:hydantoinase/oxoprolinase N-terminal domain-containing protein n=1 Tax=Loktanella sp. S4079 TaxID=579483 RepID=UPI0005FA1BF0|nr:hydantoinase/oxoprolinase family protein [Loktanella sp. S4079]KJZ21180.1 hydantoinase [Loktanella sp. S4079]
MAFLLGVDTGGTYTDAVVFDELADQVVATAKALTTRPDLSLGIAAAIDAALAEANVPPAEIVMVSLSTTLATNALVEGQGGQVALIAVGFDDADVQRSGLNEAMGGDTVIRLKGGHDHAGVEVAELDLSSLRKALTQIGDDVSGFAVAASFATRNPAHEKAVRGLIRELTGKPVTCSHELSQALGGPKRALTAVLNARLIGMIDRLITACEDHLKLREITARLMVVRGDGALISAQVAREKPIETILSGPAASVAGACWLSGQTDALVSDIGGTTTDVCLLRDGRPSIDPQGAQVGKFRTMVEAVAMRTTGLGGDSEVHLVEGLAGQLHLGPRRVMPISLAATLFPHLVHPALDRALVLEIPAPDGGQFVVPIWDSIPAGLDTREAAVAERLRNGPLRLGEAIQNRTETPALGRLVTRGLVMIAGVTPSDAAHVLGKLDSWDRSAAEKALTLFARRRTGGGRRVADDSGALANMIVDQLTTQTVDCLLQTCFAEDGFAGDPAQLARHPLVAAGFHQHRGLLQMNMSVGLPIIGLGASARAYYGAVGERLGAKMELPINGKVANAIGAVVGQVRMQLDGTVINQDGIVAALPDGPERFADVQTALKALEDALTDAATEKAIAAGVTVPRISVTRDIKEAEVEGQMMFIEANLRVTASGRPRIAHG